MPACAICIDYVLACIWVCGFVCLSSSSSSAATSCSSKVVQQPQSLHPLCVDSRTASRLSIIVIIAVSSTTKSFASSQEHNNATTKFNIIQQHVGGAVNKRRRCVRSKHYNESLLRVKHAWQPLSVLPAPRVQSTRRRSKTTVQTHTHFVPVFFFVRGRRGKLLCMLIKRKALSIFPWVVCVSLCSAPHGRYIPRPPKQPRVVETRVCGFMCFGVCVLCAWICEATLSPSSSTIHIPNIQSKHTHTNRRTQHIRFHLDFLYTQTIHPSKSLRPHSHPQNLPAHTPTKRESNCIQPYPLFVALPRIPSGRTGNVARSRKLSWTLLLYNDIQQHQQQQRQHRQQHRVHAREALSFMMLIIQVY